jgi:hypothetical protein
MALLNSEIQLSLLDSQFSIIDFFLSFDLRYRRPDCIRLREDEGRSGHWKKNGVVALGEVELDLVIAVR